MVLLLPICILLISLRHGATADAAAGPLLNVTECMFSLPTPHPDPEAVVQHLQRRVDESTRQALLAEKSTAAAYSSCLTGNPIDDCWRCDPNWQSNRQRLADCGIGFGRDALGGKGGQIYVVNDSSDDNPVNPKPGTLRFAVIQEEPLWIVFSANMMIRLKEELIVNSFKTIDGRGANVHITGAGCITLQYVSNIIIHNVHIHDCVPSGEANVRSTPTHVGWRGKSDGDGISIYGSRKIWVDHCTLYHCTDGLVDAIMGSTGITVSNNYFAHHNEVMLLGHSDDYSPDMGMQVTIAFNRFGEALVQRMPRCRLGYIHIVNNDFTEWEMYAIGGSANPTINSQGNRYTAPGNPNAKEVSFATSTAYPLALPSLSSISDKMVTKRVDTDEKDWGGWNWRTEGDIMANGAFFVPSGAGLGLKFAKASSVEPKSAGMIDQLTMNAGVLGGPRDGGTGSSSSGGGGDGGGGTAAAYGGYFGMVFGGGRVSGAAALRPPVLLASSVSAISLAVCSLLSSCYWNH
ncbi:hypothetical protein Taro_003608 [Colocasia esculenta]|uniref:Pectate lyase n=1 Tax=Colocasia esculenta TaxID=4460 RepID=A0A843THR1_COLES|nr:hypothetical protein [Colocasia esculenta]